MRSPKYLCFISFAILFLACESTTETETPVPYVSLNVGDVRQYYSESDSSYSKISIIGETHRTDGQKVFISEYVSDSTNLRFYNFIRDGYMYSTQLDSNSHGWNLEDNPYVEQRLAKVFPSEGDKWVQIDGDTPLTYFAASFHGEKSTQAKVFSDVFTYILEKTVIEYYANGFGHIGITRLDGSYPKFVNYIKVNGKEYGEYVPQDQLPKRTALKVEAKKEKYGFFGERLK